MSEDETLAFFAALPMVGHEPKSAIQRNRLNRRWNRDQVAYYERCIRDWRSDLDGPRKGREHCLRNICLIDHPEIRHTRDEKDWPAFDSIDDEVWFKLKYL